MVKIFSHILFSKVFLSRLSNIPSVFNPLPDDKILDWSKLKQSADDNFEFDVNTRKFSKLVETLWVKEKLLVTSNFSFSHSVFKRPVSQGRQKVSLCGNGLILRQNQVLLTLSEMTNFTFFQIESVCRLQFQIWWKWQEILQLVSRIFLLFPQCFFFLEENNFQYFKSIYFGICKCFEFRQV